MATVRTVWIELPVLHPTPQLNAYHTPAIFRAVNSSSYIPNDSDGKPILTRVPTRIIAGNTEIDALVIGGGILLDHDPLTPAGLGWFKQKYGVKFEVPPPVDFEG